MANDKTYVTETPFSEVQKYKERLDKFLKENSDFLAKNNIFESDFYINLGKHEELGKYEEIDPELPDLDTDNGKIRLKDCKARMNGYLEKHINAEVGKRLEIERLRIEKEIRAKYPVLSDKVKIKPEI